MIFNAQIMDNENNKKKGPQQRPEDAQKQNAQQEREYREQKEGKLRKVPKQVTDKEAIEKYSDLERKKVKGKKEEE